MVFPFSVILWEEVYNNHLQILVSGIFSEISKSWEDSRLIYLESRVGLYVRVYYLLFYYTLMAEGAFRYFVEEIKNGFEFGWKGHKQLRNWTNMIDDVFSTHIGLWLEYFLQ